MKKKNLLDFDKNMIENFICGIGEKKFVAYQIIDWIYKKFCFNFLLMSNVKFDLRIKLVNLFTLSLPKIIKVNNSVDGVIKWLLLLNDGNFIETVYIPEINRSTLCISSQVGCCVNCSFCSTGKNGFKRNLYVSEIIGQVLLIFSLIHKSIYNIKPVTNIVFMGMGEPLLNFNNVISSIKNMLDPYFLGISKRKIILSTSGIVPYIYKLINLIDIILVISLHASNNELRNKIMPINMVYDLNSLLKVMVLYLKFSKSNRNKLHIEYIMLNNINDNEENAYELLNLLKNIPSKINLIPFNNIKNNDMNYIKSDSNRILKFHNILINNGVFSFIRRTRGYDINASCGQLSGNI